MIGLGPDQIFCFHAAHVNDDFAELALSLFVVDISEGRQKVGFDDLLLALHLQGYFVRLQTTISPVANSRKSNAGWKERFEYSGIFIVIKSPFLAPIHLFSAFFFGLLDEL